MGDNNVIERKAFIFNKQKYNMYERPARPEAGPSGPGTGDRLRFPPRGAWPDGGRKSSS